MTPRLTVDVNGDQVVIVVASDGCGVLPAVVYTTHHTAEHIGAITLQVEAAVRHWRAIRNRAVPS